LAGNPNSCLLTIQNFKLRCLIDTGAYVSLIHKQIFQKLNPKPKFIKDCPSIQSVNGGDLSVEGSAEIEFKFGKQSLKHKFYIIDGINRNIILGRDWLKQNGVRIYFDLGYLRVGKTYVRLEEDIHISSIVRLQKKTVLKPNTVTICHVKLNKCFNVGESQLLTLTGTLEGVLSEQPEITIYESLNRVRNPRKVPIMLVNNSQKFINLKRGTVVGKVGCVKENEINSVSQPKVTDQDDIYDDINVPEGYRDKIERLVQNNRNIFAQKDTELGKTQTVEMRLDTGNHEPIKQKLYRIPITQRKVVDEAIDQLRQAKIIERSRSPWCFPLLLVKKKDDSTRVCVDFRALNKCLKPISYPLPLIDDILALLGGAKFFSCLDLRCGYYQVPLSDDSKERTAFGCHRGLYQFRVMPFALPLEFFKN